MTQTRFSARLAERPGRPARPDQGSPMNGPYHVTGTQEVVVSVPTVVAERDARAFSLRGIIASHPVTAYFVLAFVGAWLFLLPMVLSVDGLGLLGFQVPLPLYAALFILGTYAGPTLGAYVVTGVLEGRAGMRRLFRRYGQWRVGVLPWFLALFGYPLLYLIIGTVMFGATPIRGLLTHPLTFVTTYLPAVLIFPALITWGEEPGWRGFALTRLQAMRGPLVAALVVGLVHGLWHLPVFLLKAGPVALGPWNPVAFIRNTLMIMVFTVIWTWVFNMANGSILIAVMLHASVNATPSWLRSFAPELQAIDQNPILSYALVIGLALLVVVLTRGRLAYKPPAEAPQAEAS